MNFATATDAGQPPSRADFVGLPIDLTAGA
jgi:hypothetical protein